MPAQAEPDLTGSHAGSSLRYGPAGIVPALLRGNGEKALSQSIALAFQATTNQVNDKTRFREIDSTF